MFVKVSGCVFSASKLAESLEVTPLWAVPWEQESMLKSLWDSNLGRGGKVQPCPPPAEPGEPCAWLTAPLGRKAGREREDVSVFSRALWKAVSLKVVRMPAGNLPGLGKALQTDTE